LLTKDEICIAFVGEEILRDKIPLAEIVNIEKLDFEIFKEGSSDPNSTSESQTAYLFNARRVEEASTHGDASVLKVSTKQVGYNSGRTYYFQPQKYRQDHLVNELISNADIARRKAEGKTRFQNSQDAVRKFINSRPSNIVTGLLLITV
jgi:hypothetical protein